MSKPYKEVKAGEPILAQDWNAIQGQIHEHILTHTHTGAGEAGAKIDVDIRTLAAAADMSVRKLNAGEGLTVGSAGQPLLTVNPAATNQEGNYHVNVAGTLRAEQVRTGRLDGITSLAVGDLAISGSTGIGTTAPGGYKLKVEGGDTHLGGALTVVGAANLNGGLTVTGATALGGNVGIGTASADKKLTVSSGAEHLQLRREATETTGGKLLFLELYQHDPRRSVPEVYPSIRFHHSGQYWHRIEGRRNGFHLKEGDLNGEGYVDLQAATITATKFVGEGAFVTGMIVMWSGMANQIPSGWALCDGSRGTPDLRARFIIGAGADPAPGQYGEADAHVHAITLQNTALTTTPAGGHSHAMPAEWADQNGLNGVAAVVTSTYGTIDRMGSSVRAVRTGAEANHTHNVTLGGAPFNSGAPTGQNRPRWYALCLIMKL